MGRSKQRFELSTLAFQRLEKGRLCFGALQKTCKRHLVANRVIAAIIATQKAHISGDDYHLWDRDQPLWQTTTHLNPRANNLAAMTSSVIDLSESRSISINHYDHSIGRFSETSSLSHNDFVVVSGLLVFYIQQSRRKLA